MADTTTTIIGNLTEDPEVRFTPNGAAVSNFTLAVTPRRPDGKGGWEDGETSFFRCTAWRSLAEHLGDSLSKGDRVMVYGRLQQRSWETPEGEKRSVVEIQAEELGVSLRFATAKPTRASRSSRSAAAAGEFNEEPPF